MRISVVIAIVGGAALGIALASSRDDSDNCGSEGLAAVMAQNFVKRTLHDPDSATFRNVSAGLHPDNDCAYFVRGEFSARNGFGSMTPGVFIVDMHKTPGENLWRADGLYID
jgi:hypothetical protein